MGHWVDHNESHKDTFLTWAQRVKDQDVKDQNIGDIVMNLEKAGQLSQEITTQLKQALKKFES